MNEVEIGGQLVPQQSFEAIAQISSNKTLLVQQLTDKPTKPEPIKGLKNVDEVFQHFKPSVKAEFESAEGAPVKEELKFNNLADFRKEGIIAQTNFLKETYAQQDTYQKIVKQLKTNKILKSALQNPESKAAYLNALQALIQEIDQAG
jgi:predicted component of type VI protein secretion system